MMDQTDKKLIRISTVPMALRYLLPGQMRFMQEHGFEVLMISADGKELKDVIAGEQCRHIIVPMTRKITPVQDLKCLWQLIRIFKKERPDIVHTHTPKAGLLGMLAAKISGVKVRIHTVAGLPLMVETGFKYRLLKNIERLTYAAATQVWPNSPSLLSFIRKEKLAPAKKLSMIGKGSTNGINTNRFNRAVLDDKLLVVVKNKIGYDPQHRYLLCVGRLVADKGIVELVNAFTGLNESFPSLKLILVGEYEPTLDPLPAATLTAIEQNKNIIAAGWSDQVEYYMAIADYFVFPSHREGFPNVLLQAGAMQLPILCSAIPGNTDIVQAGQTGLVFGTGEEVAIRDAIRQAIDEPAKMKEMADRLYQTVQTNYKRENVWQYLLEAYHALLNKANRS